MNAQPYPVSSDWPSAVTRDDDLVEVILGAQPENREQAPKPVEVPDPLDELPPGFDPVI